MSKIVLFDMDGTLTPARKAMPRDIAEKLFNNLANKVKELKSEFESLENEVKELNPPHLSGSGIN